MAATDQVRKQREYRDLQHAIQQISSDAQFREQLRYDPGEIIYTQLRVYSEKAIQSLGGGREITLADDTEGDASVNSLLMSASPEQPCKTCGRTVQQCLGHYGVITLADNHSPSVSRKYFPVYNHLLLRKGEHILNLVCS